MARVLRALGYVETASPRRAKFVIVNTCGFIESARQESYGTLAELVQERKSGQVFIAAGCLAQCYGAEVAVNVPGIDGIIGTRTWSDIGEMARRLEDPAAPRPWTHLPPVKTVCAPDGVRQVAVQGTSAWLKIADGCRHRCAFCAIPSIKGPAVSRPPDVVIDDARWLQSQGVREIILIAQDTTAYGADLGMKNGLAGLLRDVSAAVPDVDWLRVMYAYPGGVTGELIEVMASHPRIVPYIDLPLQHAHPAVLRRMGRPDDMEQVRRTLEKVRNAMPGVALRTTFIVGYPGETEEEFRCLLDFIADVRFDRVGAFTYSFEKGTPAQPLGDPISPEEKEDRLRRLMERQQDISLAGNRAFIGRTLDVLVEGSGQGVSAGRSYRDAPEIDGLVIVEGELPAGNIVPVHITGASVYDLSGVVE